MEQFSSNLENNEKENLLVKVVRVLGILLSGSVLVVICFWTISWYDREINDLPLIAALQGEIRVKPQKNAGESPDLQGLSVNEVLDSRSVASATEPTLSLAPMPEGVYSNENSVITIPGSQEASQALVAQSITAALEALLGVENAGRPEQFQNIKLYISSFSTANKANAHWFLLKQLNNELLGKYDHEVSKVIYDGETLYRLSVTGFKSLALAKDVCTRLTDRGEHCVPTVSDG